MLPMDGAVDAVMESNYLCKTDGMQVGGDHWCVLIMDTISFQYPLCTPLTSLLYDLQFN
jgi:hypothetical protein